MCRLKPAHHDSCSPTPGCPMRARTLSSLLLQVNILRELRHPMIVRYYDRIIDKAATKVRGPPLCQRGHVHQAAIHLPAPLRPDPPCAPLSSPSPHLPTSSSADLHRAGVLRGRRPGRGAEARQEGGRAAGRGVRVARVWAARHGAQGVPPPPRRVHRQAQAGAAPRPQAGQVRICECEAEAARAGWQPRSSRPQALPPPVRHLSFFTRSIFLDGSGNVKLGDFGLAKELPSGSKLAYTSLGTVRAPGGGGGGGSSALRGGPGRE